MELILKPRKKEHVEKFWDRTQDEEIKRLFPFSIESLEKALILFDESMKEDALSYGKVIYYKNQYVGDVWCYGIDEVNEKMAMLSIVIFEKELWGKGIASKATRIFIKEMFNKYTIDKIGAFTYSSNHGSIGFLKNVGFIEIESFVENGIESKYLELRRF